MTDTGAGIRAEDLTRIFNPGFTTTTTRKDRHGYGLHASACGAMELRGQLTAESKGLGRGATFKLTLPRRFEG